MEATHLIYSPGILLGFPSVGKMVTTAGAQLFHGCWWSAVYIVKETVFLVVFIQQKMSVRWEDMWVCQYQMISPCTYIPALLTSVSDLLLTTESDTEQNGRWHTLCKSSMPNRQQIIHELHESLLAELWQFECESLMQLTITSDDLLLEWCPCSGKSHYEAIVFF